MNKNLDHIYISIIIITRGRSDLLEFHWNLFLSLAKYPDNIELSLYIDDDDVETIEKYKEMKAKNSNVRAVIGPRPENISIANNMAYDNAFGRNLFFITGDDCKCRTEEWDRIIIEEFNKVEDKIILVYGNDGKHGAKMATSMIIHKNWIDTVGYMFPPYFKVLMNDLWLTDVARGINRIVYRGDLIIKHLWKKTSKDQTFKYRKKFGRESLNLYKDLLNEREMDMRKLQKFIEKKK